MFGRRYFGARYFAPRYFGVGSGHRTFVELQVWCSTNLNIAYSTVVVVFEFGKRVFRSSRQDRTITSQKDPFRDQ